MPSKQRLHQYLLGLDQKHSVSRYELKNQELEQDVKSIVNKALDKVTEQDNRFQFTLHNSGSYYDGVKVGSPDEFDYIAELTSLQGQSVAFAPTDDPGFVQIKLNTQYQRLRWKGFLSKAKQLQTNNAAVQHRCRRHTLVDSGDSDDSDDSEDACDDVEDTYRDSFHPKNKENISDDMVIAPFKLQKRFKKLFDMVMLKMDLPANWEHGGYQRPHYGGCRRHGPATMIMLVYRKQDEEIKINVDITLGIPIPCPVDFKRDLNMNVFDNVESGSMMEEILEKAMKHGPLIHLIPLYSKMLVKLGHYSNKFSFRISCSLIEKAILDSLPDDAGPKKCFRVLKVIRDEYFSEGKRKTHRKKKKKSKQQRGGIHFKNPAVSAHARRDTRPGHARSKKKYMYQNQNKLGIAAVSDQTLKGSRQRALCIKSYRNNFGKENADKKCSDKLQKPDIMAYAYARLFVNLKWSEMVSNRITLTVDNNLKEESDETNIRPKESYVQDYTHGRNKITANTMALGIEETTAIHLYDDRNTIADNTAGKQLYDINTIATEYAEFNIDTDYTDTDSTDLTDLDEDTTKEESIKKFKRTRHRYQSQDIEDMICKPGSGEYYGPRTYMASIEIKMYILSLLGKKWDPEDWTDEKVCDYVVEYLKKYHTLLLKKRVMKNFFFDTMVCSPISEEQRMKALQKYKVLQKDFYNIIEGNVKCVA